MSFAGEAAKAGRIPLQVVEMDLDFCANTYGVSPCTAAIGVTGAQKCFNTYATCQDRAHFQRTIKTYRFGSRNAALPVGIAAYPLLTAVSFSPQQITPGKGLGVRASVTLTFEDMPSHDHGLDPYVKERSYLPETQGSFWGKFRARHPFYSGRFLRVLSGFIGSPFSWDDFTVREYVIDALKGPNSQGVVTIIAKDVLKLADDRKALCPVPNTGTLAQDLAVSQKQVPLFPAGVGDREYPAAGRVVVSGEGMDFTRNGDTLNLTARDVYGQGVKAHKAGDSVQRVQRYQAQAIQDVIFDLLTRFATVPTSYIDKAAWDIEAKAYLAGVWSTDICEPTGVNTLLGELTEQGLCSLWVDEIAHRIRFQALRPKSDTLPTLSEERHFLQGTVSPSQDPTQRISRVLVYFGRLDPTRKLDETSNYQTRFLDTDPNTESTLEYGTPAIRTIFSRWFSTTSLGRVEALTTMLLKRFGDPPRQLSFKLDASTSLGLGDVFLASTHSFQDATGARDLVNLMVVQVQEEKAGSVMAYQAQENVYRETGSLEQSVIFTVDGANLNLFDAYVAEFGTPSQAVQVRFTVSSGIVISSRSTALPALITGSRWPSGSVLTLINEGTITGMGGLGGAGGDAAHMVIQGRTDTVVDGTPGFPGQPGGPAVQVQFPLAIQNLGHLWGGGGGGGGGGGAASSYWGSLYTYEGGAGGGGGGGAGTIPGNGAPGGTLSNAPAGTGQTGTDAAGGSGGLGAAGGGPDRNHVNQGGHGGNGGAGGNPGQPGQVGAPAYGGLHPDRGVSNHPGGVGGEPGAAVLGSVQITWITQGDIQGPLR